MITVHKKIYHVGTHLHYTVEFAREYKAVQHSEKHIKYYSFLMWACGKKSNVSKLQILHCCDLLGCTFSKPYSKLHTFCGVLKLVCWWSGGPTLLAQRIRKGIFKCVSGSLIFLRLFKRNCKVTTLCGMPDALKSEKHTPLNAGSVRADHRPQNWLHIPYVMSAWARFHCEDEQVCILVNHFQNGYRGMGALTMHFWQQGHRFDSWPQLLHFDRNQMQDCLCTYIQARIPE